MTKYNRDNTTMFKKISYALCFLLVHQAIQAVGERVAYDSVSKISETAFKLQPALTDAAQNIGINSAKTLAAAIQNGSPALQELAKALPHIGEAGINEIAQTFKDSQPLIHEVTNNLDKIGEKFGAEFGAKAVQSVGAGALLAGAKAKAAVLAGKKVLLIVAGAPATPYIVGVIVVGAAGYTIYHYYNKELVARERRYAEIEKFKAEALQHKAAALQHSIAVAQSMKVLEKKKCEANFKEALIRHKNDKRDAQGIPLSCQQQAAHLSVVASSKKVERIVASLNKMAPQAV
jgi:hypothetical protein